MGSFSLPLNDAPSGAMDTSFDLLTCSIAPASHRVLTASALSITNSSQTCTWQQIEQ